MVAPAGGRLVRVAGALALAAALLAGCAGEKKQDEDERRGDYQVQVDASFPTDQKLAERSTLEVRVKNVDTKQVPNVALTVTGFDERGLETQGAEFADTKRPVFSINEEPKGGETAYRDTWALGDLEPGETKTFRFDVTAIKRGPFEIRYEVAAGLDGKARAVEGGQRPRGEFAGSIEGDAPSARVADDGETILREGDGAIGPENR